MTPLEILRIMATEFSSIEDSVVNSWIELTKPFVNSKRFGNTYSQALALLAAHKLKMAGYGNVSGTDAVKALNVSSYSEGEVSVGFNSNQATNMLHDGELSLTVYGLQFLNLRRVCIVPIVSAGE